MERSKQQRRSAAHLVGSGIKAFGEKKQRRRLWSYTLEDVVLFEKGMKGAEL